MMLLFKTVQINDKMDYNLILKCPVRPLEVERLFLKYFLILWKSCVQYAAINVRMFYVSNIFKTTKGSFLYFYYFIDRIVELIRRSHSPGTFLTLFLE